ncbi:MAG: winged helix-turn-helix transcriptional regulator, partial [Planctomycetota bacterium]|jgi:hypothetical protein
VQAGGCGRVDGVARRGHDVGDGSRVVRDRCLNFLRAHLGELVRDGFVDRRQNPRDRRDVTYVLTVLGRSLLPTMETLRAWSVEQGMVAKATASLGTIR